MDMLDRQKEIFGQVPLKTVADGGFASKENLYKGKEAGVRDVAFSKKRGLKVLEMVKSTWVYRQLHNFRAGIEANISHLKRSFGLRRCNWTGWEGFKQYVWSSVVSYNLLALARLNIKTARQRPGFIIQGFRMGTTYTSKKDAEYLLNAYPSSFSIKDKT